MDILGTIFAGLGLFFIGVKLISSNLRAMSGGTLRRYLARVTSHPLAAGAIGALGGALTQSTNAMTFIVISLVTSGMVALRRALPMVIWANLGTSVLVLLATVNMQLLILYLLGMTGMGFYFDLDKSTRYRYLIGALLGVGMLFHGLGLIKIGAEPLQQIAFVRELLAMASGSFLIAFVIGVVVTLIVQSSATVSVISVTLISAGLLNYEQSVMIVFGASLGSGLSVLLLSANLPGTARQLALFQVLLKILGLLVVVPIFLIETWTGLPLVFTPLNTLVPALDTRVALVYLALQLASCVAMSLLSSPGLRLVARLSPPSPEEQLARPRYLYDRALDDASSASYLVEREQQRLLERLPPLLNQVRREPEADAAAEREGGDIRAEALCRANLSVVDACADFLVALTDQTRDHGLLERIVNLQARTTLIQNLNESLMELADSLRQPASHAGAEQLRDSLAEAVHALLETFSSAVANGEADDIDLLLCLTADRSSVMENTRARLLGGDSALSLPDKQQLLAATSLAERISWLMRRYAKLIKR
jgi:phosphate:Na+ symporter